MSLSKRSLLIVLILSSVLFFCERVTSPITNSKRNLTPSEKRVIASGNSFGFKLLKEITAVEESNQNVFISPLSVSMALGMTLNGAAGETFDTMQNTLDLQGLTQQEINEAYYSLIALLRSLDPNVDFRIANSIWYRNSLLFEQPFIDRNKKYFDARISGLDFANPASLGIINNWVKENTGGKIEEIIDKIDPVDIMFLINAIYFNGTWTYRFDKENTHADSFHISGGGQLGCQMMEQEGEFQYFATDQFQAIDLPYGDGDFRMSIFLPRTGIDIDNFIAGLNDEEFAGWMQQFSKQEGMLELPKFRLEYEKLLNDVLSALGMAIAFDPQLADFSNLYSGTEPVSISRVMHKSFVRVDEEGTEAAAATSVTISFTSAGGQFYMKVNRPFLFLIRENRSGVILFAGKICDPVWD